MCRAASLLVSVLKKKSHSSLSENTSRAEAAWHSKAIINIAMYRFITVGLYLYTFCIICPKCGRRRLRKHSNFNLSLTKIRIIKKNMLTSCKKLVDTERLVQYYTLFVDMSIFDIIVYIALAWAVFNGWRRGFLLQLVTLVALVAGLFLAAQYGAVVGAMLGIADSTSAIAGFVVIFLLSLLAVTIVGHMLRAVLRFTGLGVMDVVLGVLFSVLKVGLVVGVMFSWFTTINNNYSLVEKQTIEESRWFTPTVEVVGRLTPFFKDIANDVLNK
jgi:membrane protein required for colicin V production